MSHQTPISVGPFMFKAFNEQFLTLVISFGIKLYPDLSIIISMWLKKIIPSPSIQFTSIHIA